MKIIKLLQTENAFSLVELLIVIALISLISTFGVVNFVQYSKNQVFSQSVSDFINVLNTAKSRTYSQIIPPSGCDSFQGYSVAFDTNNYSLIINCGVAKTTLNTYPLPNTNITIETTDVPKKVNFLVVNGGITGNSTILFKGYGTLTKTVTISSTGVISK